MIKSGNKTTMNQFSDATISAYDLAPDAYIANSPQIVGGTMQQFLDRFMSRLTPGTQIYEIGSGFGRDADYIEQQALGFSVVRTDASKWFVNYLAQQGLQAAEVDIRTTRPHPQQSAVLADAVLLHFNIQEAEAALQNIAAGLLPGGIFGLVVKKQLKEDVIEEWVAAKSMPPRYFRYWKEEAFIDFIKQFGFDVLDSVPDSLFIQLVTRFTPKQS